jgi:TrmH family RNA methyltransferase
VASFRADPIPLTSGNTRVKQARKLARRAFRAEHRLFLAEGPHAVGSALGVAGCVVEVFALPGAPYDDLRAEAADRWTPIDEAALRSLTEAVQPQGVVAVCRFVDRPLEHLLADRTPGAAGLLAICADVRDPGNAGAIIRVADAVGADAVVLAGESVDAYNAKTVRATAGSLFQVPLATDVTPEAAVRRAQEAGLTVLAADGSGELDLFHADEILTQPTAWLFGNEAHGLSSDVAALADHRVRIPIRGRAESLNLSTAAAVCLYASARERAIKA